MRIAMIILASTLFSTSAFARCYTNSYRHVVCTNGERAATYNSHTGTTWHSARNEHGVVTTHTSRGGYARTRNGNGVYHTANGKDCYKTGYSHGCD